MKTDSPVSKNNSTALLLDRVSKKYHKPSLLHFFGRPQKEGSQALKDVSFSIREGETIGLLGPNGAGKTTLLKIISTLILPDQGKVFVYGRDVSRDPIHTRRMMGLVTCDERSFYWRLTGRHNLMFFSMLYGLSMKGAGSRIDLLLQELGLADAADRPFQTYSSGMKQKLAIARGLLSDPRIILYDEPTRSLDPLSAQNIRKWIIERRKESPKQTHVIATNQLHEAEQLCDRVIIISQGNLVAQGTPQEIRQQWHVRSYEVHRITYRGDNVPDLIKADPGKGLFHVSAEKENGSGISSLRIHTERDSEVLSNTLDIILRSGGTIVQCCTEQVSLDDVFCSLVVKGKEKTPGQEGRA